MTTERTEVVRYIEAHLDNIDSEWADHTKAKIHEDVLRDVHAMLSDD